MSEEPPLATLAEAEVRAAHRFFVDWFRGEAADFDDWEAAFAADFHMIPPDGSLAGRDAVVERVRRAHGTAPADFAIDILAVEALDASADRVLLIYVERQYRGGDMTDRRSTALFSRDERAPRGVLWCHLQETWMQAA